jgi:3-oxoisoapionate decarboxylase
MTPTRREWLVSCAGAAPLLAGLSPEGRAGPPPVDRNPLGVVIHSYAQRSARDRDRAAKDRIDDPMTFVDFIRDRGGQGVQVGLGRRDEEWADALRKKLESHRMYLEGTLRLPRDPADLGRFTAEAETARRAGATVLRTVMLGSRRYETFTTASAFRRFVDEAVASLALAKPVVEKLGVRLAVENHKDFRADQLLAILGRADSENIGVCLDTGNSISLLEDPIEVVEALAPRAFTTHLKDMAVDEYEKGFLLSEVPFGRGFLDLGRIVRVLREARPEIRFNVEMITRDPLQVPCLTETYWATFEDLPGRHLARSLAMVRAHRPKQPLPRVSDLPAEEKLRVEDDNVRLCLSYAREQLGLASA